VDRHSSLPNGLTWRGGIIHIDTTVGGSRISRSCKTASVPEARRLLETLRGQVRIADLTGIHAHILKAKTSLEEFIDQELVRLQVDGASPKTLAKYKGIMATFARFVRQQLKGTPTLDDIDHGMVQSYKSHAATTLRTRIEARKLSIEAVSFTLPLLAAPYWSSKTVMALTATSEGLAAFNRSTTLPRILSCGHPRPASASHAGKVWEYI
jgi:hypothetical protein